MNILFIARNYPPQVGGAERLNYELIQNLKNLMDIEVIPNKFGKYSPLFHIYAVFKAVLNRKNIEVVFLSDAYLSPIIPIIKLILKKPVVIKVHGLDITFSNKIYQLIIPRFVNMADKVICISNATKKECIRRGVSPDKCKVILIGINGKDPNDHMDEKAYSKFNIDEHKYILLSVGRLVERKGIHWFVENVIPKLIKKEKNITYVIAGDGPYRETIENIILSKGLEDYVKLLGKVSDDDLELLYNIADIFIMPNIPVDGDMEGFGIVVLEASSHGVPVIASDLEGIRDAVINGKTGFLVEPLNEDAYVEKILEMLDKVKKDRKMKENIKKLTLQNYNWDKISQEYYDVFCSVIKNKN
ncbi:glycosyltransferase family 4 protein [Methanotorris igneus]|uniref:Glycosyl transferase group 1 n=1 Tax=Methanotorris igneus (strain DSM 5666 / JCM 11834 / Kol 5) TaxID=880724 RepID=F6BAW9_METIK|nr:glycosyltransferase [Methanotorris igneus]AEF97056.1 glycosyl transferase group 1 [Methanotorris igneus Kol 5]